MLDLTVLCGWTRALHRPSEKGAFSGCKAYTGMDDRDSAPPKPAPQEVMMRWARKWAKEGVEPDPKKLLPAEGPRGHCCRGVGLWSVPFLGFL
jgi:hypothetical protein